MLKGGTKIELATQDIVQAASKAQDPPNEISAGAATPQDMTQAGQAVLQHHEELRSTANNTLTEIASAIYKEFKGGGHTPKSITDPMSLAFNPLSLSVSGMSGSSATDLGALDGILKNDDGTIVGVFVKPLDGGGEERSYAFLGALKTPGVDGYGSGGGLELDSKNVTVIKIPNG